MQLFGWIILCCFLTITTGKYQEDSDDELDTALREVLRSKKNNEMLLSKKRNEDLKRAGGAPTPAKVNIYARLENPVRIALFNAGDYFAYLKLNFILNNLQDEQEIAVPIEKDSERDLLLPHNATHIRIRVDIQGYLKDQHFIDQQFRTLNNITEICYLLAGDRSRPIYGLCAAPFKQYYQLWQRSR
ncbi:unnamed protein product [Adineta ricciae]|uniref:Uncharacterized protein n=1 Tax=Adineta ricciae TaxID=249248 RepID=A0A816AIV7_ADIRI|nr:unnamed protein product [Adineta ricciae]